MLIQYDNKFRFTHGCQRLLKRNCLTDSHASGFWSNLNLVLRTFSHRYQFLGSIVVSIPACHAGDRGSIPRRGDGYIYIFSDILAQSIYKKYLAFYTRSVDPTLADFIVCGLLQFMLLI